MTNDEKIKRAIKQMVKVPLQVVQAEVKSVNKSDNTCVVTLSGEIDIEDVRLRSVTGSAGHVIYPKVASKVLVAKIANSNQLYVSMFSDVDAVLIDINGKITIKNNLANLRSELDTLLDTLAAAIVQTPSGPGSFAANVIANITTVKTNVGNLLDT